MQTKEVSRQTHVTRVVDEAGEVAIASSINNSVAVHSEQVTAADANGFVPFFPEIGNRLTYYLTDVFYHHLSLGDRLQCKQTPVVDATLGKLQLLLTELQQIQYNTNICSATPFYSSENKTMVHVL